MNLSFIPFIIDNMQHINIVTHKFKLRTTTIPFSTPPPPPHTYTHPHTHLVVGVCGKRPSSLRVKEKIIKNSEELVYTSMIVRCNLKHCIGGALMKGFVVINSLFIITCIIKTCRYSYKFNSKLASYKCDLFVLTCQNIII